MDSKGQKEKTRSRVIDLLTRQQRTVREPGRRLHRYGHPRPNPPRRAGAEGTGPQARRPPGRPGRKPATVYEITVDAESGFSRVYAPVLGVLVETLSERLSERELEAVLRETGRRLAELQPRTDGNLDRKSVV